MAQMIKGVFEVHLITIPEKQMQLFGCVENLKSAEGLIRIRPTCAYSLYGNHPNQPMVTFWLSGNYPAVKEKVDKVCDYLIRNNIPIIRQKIEAMASNEGVPEVCVGHGDYFEFHFKVKDINSTKRWDELVDVITPHGAHLFHNPYNKNLVPIVTIRSYWSLAMLRSRYEELIADLHKNKFNMDQELEREYSVLDTNVWLDQNWLFESKPHNYTKLVDPKMKFNIDP